VQKIFKNPLTIILFVALGLRLISLNQSLWLDEAIGAIAVHDYSYTGIVTDFIKGDTHPPLYYLTLKLWTDIFGYSEIAMRSLSVLFGVIAIYVVYSISRFTIYDLRIKNGKWLPLLTTLLFATAPLHIYYSQEVRMYSLNTLLVSLVVLFYLKNNWFKYSISLLILGMTDYLPLLILPALWIYSLIQKKDLNWWKKFIVSHLPLAIFLVLWVPTFIIQSAGSREALQLFPGWGQLIGKAGIKELSLVWIKFLIGRITFENKILYGFLVLLPSVIVAMPLFKSIQKFNQTKLFWLWLTIPIAVTFVGAIFVPGFSYFRMIIVLPAFYLLIAYGLTQLNSKILALIVILINFSFSLIYLFNPSYHREDWKGSVAYINSNKKSGDVVLQSFPEPFAGYRWYAKRCGDVISAYGATGKLGATNDEIVANTKHLTETATGVYYFEYLHDQTDPSGLIPQTLVSDGFTKQTAKDFRGVGIVEYWKK
jgi:uncharacterized membrane protein